MYVDVSAMLLLSENINIKELVHHLYQERNWAYSERDVKPIVNTISLLRSLGKLKLTVVEYVSNAKSKLYCYLLSLFQN